MIEFLYKVIHCEISVDRKMDIFRSFSIIWALFSTLPVGLIYVIYSKLSTRNIYTDVLFYTTEFAIMASIYYFIVVPHYKIYNETSIGLQYFHFGKFNGVLKILVFISLFGFMVLLGALGIKLLGHYL